MGFATSAKLKERIDAEAEGSGRSRTQEIERRLEQSFMLDDMTTSQATRALVSFVQLAAETLEWENGGKWTDDADTALQLAGAITFYVDRHRPRRPDELDHWQAMDLIKLQRTERDKGKIDNETLGRRSTAITNALAAFDDYRRGEAVRGTNSLAQLEELFSTKERQQ
ncbi:hypothetical protein [Sphingomonas sp.]|uniref:hypothetical protein n=1 Tax=Sphingomonas sp. TaxID=28214 RepID=UPI0037525BAB